jgi:hypothetical protein
MIIWYYYYYYYYYYYSSISDISYCMCHASIAFGGKDASK